MTERTSDQFIEILEQEVKGLSTALVDEDYTNAVRDAQMETGFSLPLDDTSFEFYWLKERAKRHLFFYLYSESAHKFKVDQINLQHRFEHYRVLIELMDKKFEAIMESEPTKFANVSTVNMFGTKFDAGFSYQSQTGIDTTYGTGNKVVVTPSETD